MTGQAASADDPGLFRLLPALVTVALAWLALFPITTVDAYYHLATGRRILESGAIPDRGVGSATFGASAWHDNEWGFQVLAASLARHERDVSGVWTLTAASRVRLIALRAAVLALTLTLLSGQMASSGVGPLSRAVALVWVAFLTFGNLFWAIRPQILSYALLALTAYLLQRDRSGQRWAGAATLGVVALWANVHGAFVIGIAMIGLEAIGEWIDALRAERPEARRRAVRLSVIGAIAPAAALLNPLGYHQLLHPFLYLQRPEIYLGNAEWSAPDFRHLPPLVVLTAVVLGVALAAGIPRRSADLLRCVVFGLLAATALRHIPMAAIVGVPILFSSLTAAASRGGWRRNLLPTGPAWGSPALRGAAAGAIVVTVVALSAPKFVGPLPRFEERPVRPMPEREVRLLAAEPSPGTVFNSYRFGGFLMYRLYPREVAFMDGRNDLYLSFRDEVYNPILTASSGWRTSWRDAVERYDVRWVLVDEEEGLARELSRDPAWERREGPPGASESGIVLLRRRGVSRPGAARSSP